MKNTTVKLLLAPRTIEVGRTRRERVCIGHPSETRRMIFFAVRVSAHAPEEGIEFAEDDAIVRACARAQARLGSDPMDSIVHALVDDLADAGCRRWRERAVQDGKFLATRRVWGTPMHALTDELV